jgi:hypothetical protein
VGTIPSNIKRSDFGFHQQQNEQTTDCITPLNRFKLVENTIEKIDTIGQQNNPHQLLEHRHGRKQRGHDNTEQNGKA